ncbi:MAG: ComEC/Rec2 family competence protein [Candidatus Omnitrophota bacterium]|nr:ComEC/Rec2 family competence protein [Candidatus Omnitrophota bacterium]
MTQRPFVGIFMFWAIGIICHRYISASFSGVVALSCLFLFVAMLGRHRPICWNVCLGAALIGVSFLYAQNVEVLPRDHIHHVARYYSGKLTTLKGTVATDVETRSFFNKKKKVFTLQVEEIKTPWGWRPKSGKVLVNVFQDKEIHCGDLLRIEGKLHRPYNFSDGNFSYTDYLEMKGVYWILSVGRQASVEILKTGYQYQWLAAIFRWRDHLTSVFDKYLSPAEAGLMSAMILGDRAAIPAHIMDLFEHTGTVHVLAISGFNVGIVAGLFLLILKIFPIGRKTQLWLAIGLLIVYCVLTGSPPSVVRATIMIIVFLLGFLLERPTDSLNTLGLAGLLLLLINPFHLFDIGFQLSFLAVLIIILVGPRLELIASSFSSQYAKWLINALGISLSVWLGLAGFIAYYFQIVTPIIFVANLIVIPLMSAVVALGLGLLAFAFISGYCAQMFALCLKLLLNVVVASIYLMDQLPGAYFLIKSVNFWQVVIYYLGGTGLLILILFLKRFFGSWYNKPASIFKINDGSFKSRLGGTGRPYA